MARQPERTFKGFSVQPLRECYASLSTQKRHERQQRYTQIEEAKDLAAKLLSPQIEADKDLSATLRWVYTA